MQDYLIHYCTLLANSKNIFMPVPLEIIFYLESRYISFCVMYEYHMLASFHCQNCLYCLNVQSMDIFQSMNIFQTSKSLIRTSSFNIDRETIYKEPTFIFYFSGFVQKES